MKTFGLAVLSLLVAPIVCAQVPLNTATPAQQKIAWAEAAIKAHPDHSQPYNDLAVAYVRRARETADPGYYDQAETALQKSFQITPDNLEGQKARLMILLGRGEFARALGLAKALNKKTPDDVLLYGFIADAAIELGDYGDAEEAAQWMLDMRPGNVRVSCAALLCAVSMEMRVAPRIFSPKRTSRCLRRKPKNWPGH